jgi:hypothetical protein
MPRESAPGQHHGGRAKGTPNKATVDVKALASQHGPEAIQELAKPAGLLEGGKGKAESEQAQIGALNAFLDRGYGKPTQAIVGDPKRPVLAVTVDCPPEESREQWLTQRRRELAADGWVTLMPPSLFLWGAAFLSANCYSPTWGQLLHAQRKAAAPCHRHTDRNHCCTSSKRCGPAD